MTSHQMTRVGPFGWLEDVAARMPLHPLLFGAYLVLLVYSNNLAEVPPADVIVPLLAVSAIALLATVILAIALRDPRLAGVLVTLVLAPALAFAYIRDAVSDVWQGDDRILALAVLVAVCLLLAILDRLRSRLPSTTLALNAMSLLLVLLVLVSIVSAMSVALARSAAVSDDSPGTEPTYLAADSGQQARDIYHLVFDRYGNEEALRLAFGIDNSDFMDWLAKRGFDVVDGAHANYRGSAVSLASTLGMSLLDRVAEQMGPEVGYYGPILDRVRENPAGAWLQDRGYEYVHLGSWYPPTASSRIADGSFGPDISNDLTTAVIENSVLPVILDPFPTADERHASSARMQLDMLDEHALEQADDPRYVFAHILLPHPPYVFLADGTFAPEQATVESQLEYTNARITALVETLQGRPADEQPIIILQADEGPIPGRLIESGSDFSWEGATDEELAMIFGVLDAFYLPGPEGVAPLPPGMTPVNTYPEVLGRYFHTDLPRAADRSFAAHVDTPYDLLEVTDRLAAIDVDAPSGSGRSAAAVDEPGTALSSP